MKVFISHSFKDQNSVRENIDKIVAEYAKQKIVIEPYFAQDDFSMKKDVKDKLKKEIIDCNFAIVFLTENSMKSPATQQEIGAFSILGKPVLYVSNYDCRNDLSGFLVGVDILPYDNESGININDAIKTISKEMNIPQQQIENQYNEIVSTKANLTTSTNMEIIVVSGLILLLVIALILKGKKK